MGYQRRLLLINPWEGEIYPPPSIGYLQSACKTQNIDVRALDLSAALREEDDYDFVGASFHSFSVVHARAIREHFRRAWLVAGGHHPSAMPEQLLGIGYNQVVVGEGENAIIDIINGDKTTIIREPTRHYNSIDELPFPDYNGLKYQDNIVISSRGCPYHCSFCASADFWGHRWTPRSAENVVKEIHDKGYQSWMFEDDNFTANKRRAIEICFNMRGSWQCASRAESLDDELCYFLKKSGCHTVWLGIESFSQASLERCDKRTTVEKMVKGIETAERYGIRTVCQFIVGLPQDTITDITETSRVIRKTKMSNWGVNIAWVLPNTKVYDEAKKRGMDDSVYLESGAPFYTYEQDMNTLHSWTEIIMSAKK